MLIISLKILNLKVLATNKKYSNHQEACNIFVEIKFILVF